MRSKFASYLIFALLCVHCSADKDDNKDERESEWRQKGRSEESSRRPPLGQSDDIDSDNTSYDHDGSSSEDPVVIDNSQPTPVASGGGEGEAPGGEGQGEGEGQGQGQGEGQGEAPGPGEAETPPEFEGVWTFYHYCLIAEDQIEADKVADFFPDPEYFAQWLADIRKTVAAIRIRLNSPRDFSQESPETCQIAYDVFLRRRAFSLAPRPDLGEVFEINNVEPIAGLPGLKDLDLYDNHIIKIGFLRNLSNLEVLEVGKNRIPLVQLLYDPDRNVGLTKLRQFNIEFQNEAESPLQLDGLHILHPFHSLQIVKINANLVDPTPFRGFKNQLNVTLLNRLWFVAGSATCEQELEVEGHKWLYPRSLEIERRRRCG